MPLRIPIPKVSYATNVVPLGGQSYGFTFRFNERSGRWKLDISTVAGTVIRNGITLIEDASLTSHLYLQRFWHGILYVGQINEGTEPAGRDNIGLGKQYELLYFSHEELSV
jgi:hypothetical protein